MPYALMRHLRRTILISKQIRFESTVTNISREDVFRPPLTHWNKVVREAEKIVGYPTSFMNLRWLLSDEFSNLAMHLRKVVDINHPIVKTAKTFLYNEHNNLQPWGLIILLLSKATTPGNSLTSTTIEEQQRILAELTEMIRTGHYIHRGILNIPLTERHKASEYSTFANKIALLIGDYLLVTANGMLARMRNQDLSYIISTALRDLSASEFYGERDSQNMPLPGKSGCDTFDNYVISCDTLPIEVSDTLGSPVREWTVRTLLNGGSLLGRGCQGALLLGGHSFKQQDYVYLFGCYLCLAWQAASELQAFGSQCKGSYSLISAPVLFALSENPNLYSIIDVSKHDVADVDYEELREGVLKTNAVERTRHLYVENARKAESYIDMFGDSEAIRTVKRLIKSL